MHAACLQNAHVRLPRIDADGSGAINKEEFVRPLTRWIHESKTAPRFVKYNVDRSLQAQEEILKQNHEQFCLLAHRLDELCAELLPKTSPLASMEWQSSMLLASIEEPSSSEQEGMEEPFTKGYQIPCLEIGIEQPKESSCALKESKGEEIHEQVSGRAQHCHWRADKTCRDSRSTVQVEKEQC
ncbi:unnamed protein product [Durusdinium trenchii]|uniref:EF-hand domain-containing protein n=2 Tax=Durusdinium trenchii TaxID=1381693 RepID=A0ABP0IU10_9DINO